MKKSFSVPSSLSGMILLILSIFSFSLFLFLSCQSAAGSLLAQKMMTRKLTAEEAAKTGLKLIKTHPYGIEQLYAAMIYFCRIKRDPLSALQCIEAIQRGVTPRYGNIEGFKGDLLLQLGRVEEACNAYWQEGQNYPFSITPIYKLMRIAALRGEKEKAQKLKENLEFRKKARAINEKMMLFILQNPIYDHRPWMIPKSHGGPESERSFKFQKIGTEKAGETF